MNVIDRVHKYLQPGRSWYQREIKLITVFTVHHSDQNIQGKSNDQLLQEIMNTHVGKGWPGLSYHEVITPDGTCYLTNAMTDITWHDTHNTDSYGIVLVGNFETEEPTDAQLQMLRFRLDWLSTNCPDFPADQDDVYGHGERYATACPGINLFPKVIEYRAKKGTVAWGVYEEIKKEEPPAAPQPPKITPIQPKVETPAAPVTPPLPAPQVPSNETEFTQIKKTDLEQMQAKILRYDKIVENGYYSWDDINTKLTTLKSSHSTDCEELESEKKRLLGEVEELENQLEAVLDTFKRRVGTDRQSLATGRKAINELSEVKPIVEEAAEKLDIPKNKISMFSFLKKLDIVKHMADQYQEYQEEKKQNKENEGAKQGNVFSLLSIFGIKI